MAGSSAMKSRGLAGSPHLRGHLLLFDRGREPAHGADAGARMLLTATLVEGLRVCASRWLAVPPWLFLPALLGLALLAVKVIARMTPTALGLRGWSDWTATEKSYFLQLMVIANLVFPLVFAEPLGRRLARPDLVGSLWSGFVPYLFFGFYQELVYRGLVQRELVRRWGAPLGILCANALYTFGPLHWYYFASRASVAVPMFAGIFAIGLFFALLYRRSGNLWMAGAAHAVGNAYIIWSVGPTR